MVDFLRANSWCSREEYLWEMTVGQIRLASVDFSHVEYANKTKKNKMTAGEWLLKQSIDTNRNINDLGQKIIK